MFFSLFLFSPQFLFLLFQLNSSVENACFIRQLSELNQFLCISNFYIRTESLEVNCESEAILKCSWICSRNKNCVAFNVRLGSFQCQLFRTVTFMKISNSCLSYIHTNKYRSISLEVNMVSVFFLDGLSFYEESLLRLPFLTRVLALKGQCDSDDKFIFETNNSFINWMDWKCSQEFQEGWNKNSFNDSFWNIVYPSNVGSRLVVNCHSEIYCRTRLRSFRY